MAPTPPARSDASLDCRRFGAAGDGVHLDSLPIQRAIDHAAAAGGGRVVVPAGTYRCGTLRLASNVTLDVMPGAVIRASTDPGDYPDLPVPFGFPPQHDRDKTGLRHHLLYALDAENVTVCGGGTIDGNVAAFTPGWETKPPYTWTSPRDRPFVPMVDFTACRELRLLDVTFRDSPGWTVHLNHCDGVTVRGVRLHNYVYAGNSDGFDVNSCRDVLFSDCRIETGDDAIVLKSFREGRSSERIAIANCILQSSCAGVKIGTETWHDVRQVTIANCIVHRSSRAVQIRSQDGATIEAVVVSNLTIDTDCGINLNRALHVDVHKRSMPHACNPHLDTPVGRIRRVTMSNITLRTDGRVLLTAGDGGRLEQVTLRDLSMHLPWIEDPQSSAGLSDKMQSSPSNPDARAARAAVVAENVADLRIEGLSIAWPDGEPLDDDYLPKYEKGRLVVDPRTDDSPPAAFAAVWARNVRGGRIDTRGLTGSTDGVGAVHMEHCEMDTD